MTDTAAAPLVRLAMEEGLATITLARADAGNAMNLQVVDDLHACVSAALGNPAVRAILLEAEGKNFCVGGDIRAFSTHADPAGFIAQLATRVHESILMLAEARVPVVIAAQGASAGAGLGLAACGDVVLAGRSATYAMAYGAIGLTADGGATWLLPRLIGLRAMQEMSFTDRRLDAEEAARLGLVTRVVEDAVLADEARKVALRIAAGPTAAFGAVKRLLIASDRATLAEQLDAEAASMGAAMATRDAKEGTDAFFARRPAAFTGC